MELNKSRLGLNFFFSFNICVYQWRNQRPPQFLHCYNFQIKEQKHRVVFLTKTSDPCDELLAGTFSGPCLISMKLFWNVLYMVCAPFSEALFIGGSVSICIDYENGCACGNQNHCHSFAFCFRSPNQDVRR